MHKKAILILLLIPAFMIALLPQKANAQNNLEEEILFYTNKFRKSQGKPALEFREAISREAKQHSKNMAKGKVKFGHTGFEQRTAHIKDRIGFIHAAAENVAYGQLNAREVVDGWIKSPPHRKNLLGDYNLIGIGTAKGRNGVIYFTQVFIKQE